MQFIDLKKQYSLIEDSLKARFDRILSSARFIMGEEVYELETKLAEYVGVKECISCSSGTDALLIPLMANEIGQGDAVFVPTFTFYASAEVIAMIGATPIFVDVKEDTFNIDPVKLESAIQSVLQEGKLKPKAIIPVDLFGLPAEYDKITEIARKYDLIVIEDGAQGFGGTVQNKKACSFGAVAATSFFPAKPLGCYGDGGAIFTNDEALAEIMRSIRIHGFGKDRYENVRLGINGRLDTLQAAVLIEKLKIFQDELQSRERIARKYTEALQHVISTPAIPENYSSSWAQYTLIAENKGQRDQVMNYLKSKDIPSMIYYPIPLHQQKVFSNIKSDYCDLSVSERLVNCVFSIPMHPYLEDHEQDMIIEAIKQSLEL